MNYLNSEFFEEFKRLDNLCRGIYDGQSGKLGVTFYIEEMESEYRAGVRLVPGWDSDYRSLKRVRHLRNELAHSDNSFAYIECSRDDTDFVRDFRERILSLTDPLATLAKSVQRAHDKANLPPEPDRPTPCDRSTDTGRSAVPLLIPIIIIMALTVFGVFLFLLLS